MKFYSHKSSINSTNQLVPFHDTKGCICLCQPRLRIMRIPTLSCLTLVCLYKWQQWYKDPSAASSCTSCRGGKSISWKKIVGFHDWWSVSKSFAWRGREGGIEPRMACRPLSLLEALTGHARRVILASFSSSSSHANPCSFGSLMKLFTTYEYEDGFLSFVSSFLSSNKI